MMQIAFLGFLLSIGRQVSFDETTWTHKPGRFIVSLCRLPRE